MKNIFKKSKQTEVSETEVDQNAESTSREPALAYRGRTLHYSYETIIGRNATVVDLDTGTTLYDIDIHLRSPQLIFRRTHKPEQEPVGTVNFSMLTFRMEVLVNGNTFKLHSNWKHTEFDWNSAAFGGQKLTWKRKVAWVGLPIVLLDANQLPVAQFTPSGLSLKNKGTFEFMDATLGQQAMDEVVITALAIMQEAQYMSTMNVTAST